MSFKTDVWDDTIQWSGLIHPAVLKDIKPFKMKEFLEKTKETRNPNVQQDHILHDLPVEVNKSRKAMADTIMEIDRIKATDVPWRTYGSLFIVFSFLIGCGIFVVS